MIKIIKLNPIMYKPKRNTIDLNKNKENARK